MGEALDYSKDLYCAVYTPTLVKILQSSVQADLNRSVYNTFLNLLNEKDVRYDVDKKDNTVVKTSLGFFKVIKRDNGTQQIHIFRDMDLPHGSWQAGQLALMALHAANHHYLPHMYGLIAANGKDAMDLSVIKISAELDSRKMERTLGVLPLQHTNNSPIASSVSIIDDLKEEIFSELSLQHPMSKGAKITYEIKRAYAWHCKHGLQPGFKDGEKPKGLEAKVIDQGHVILRSVAANT